MVIIARASCSISIVHWSIAAASLLPLCPPQSDFPWWSGPAGTGRGSTGLLPKLGRWTGPLRPGAAAAIRVVILLLLLLLAPLPLL